MSEACRDPRTGHLEANGLTGMEPSIGTNNPTRDKADSYVCSCDPDFHPDSKGSLPTLNTAAAEAHKQTLDNGHFLTPRPVSQWGSCSNFDSAGYLKLRASSRSLLDDLVSQIASSNSGKEPKPTLVRRHSAEDVMANNYDHLAASISSEERTQSAESHTPANGSDIRIHISCHSNGEPIINSYDHLAKDVPAEGIMKPSSHANHIRVQIYSRTKQVSKGCIETEV